MKNLDIAIIGMSGIFPEAETISEYWNNLREGKISISNIPEDRWEQSKFASDIFKEEFKIYCNTGGFIADNKRFDYEYFNMSREEAVILDPQQRIMLQLTKKLFDHAGYSKKDYYGKNIAVYMGASLSASNELHAMYNRFFQLDKGLREKMFEKFGYPSWHSNYLSDSITNLIAGRISHEFNLTGPSMVIDTACSSSLTALHHACQLLKLEECDMAIAGGVYLHNTPTAIMGFCAAGALSPSGNLRAFDERADGFVPGEAAGLVLLKRLEDAQKDQDYIHGVIRGSVINNDGHTLGIMAPNPNRQRSVITEFYNNSEISPNDIQYMEAHGTGTKIGDLSEVNSLTQVFNEWKVQKQSVALGSVKSNIGHSISASGIVSLIKIFGMMKEKTIYKQANYERPNPRLRIEDSSFYIPSENNKLHEFRYAAINSFGFGGTNAHVILENGEAYNKKAESKSLSCYPLFIGAHNKQCLEKRKMQILDAMKASNIHDVILTANKIGREETYILPLIVKASGLTEEKAAVCQRADKKTILLFTGQGSQYLGMARAIYDSIPVFREKMDYCSRLFEKELGVNLIKLLYDYEKDIVATERAQAIIFSVGYSLGSMLLEAGLTPIAMIGHSIGEWIAAALSEAVTLEEAVRIVALRGTIMSKYNGKGGMTAVFSVCGKLDSIVKKCGVFYSAFNISHVVVGGEHEKLEVFMQELQKQNIMFRKLSVAAAFHTPMFREAAKEFEKCLEGVTFQKPKIQIIGNVTGRPIDEYTKEYWAEHLIRPVRFEECVDTAMGQKAEAAIECGGNTALLNMIGSKYPAIRGTGFLTPKDDSGEAFCNGLIETTKNSKSFAMEKCYAGVAFNHVDLPEYPFAGMRDSLFKEYTCKLSHQWAWKAVKPEEAVVYNQPVKEMDIWQDHWHKTEDIVPIRYEIPRISEAGEEPADWFYEHAQAFLKKLKQHKDTRFALTIIADAASGEAYNSAIQNSVAVFMMSLVQQIRNVEGCVVFTSPGGLGEANLFGRDLWLKYDGTNWTKRVVEEVCERDAEQTIKLEKQTILITGGNGNLGKKVCEYLLKETDCNIVILGRKEKINNKEPRINYIACDITERDQVLRARNVIQQKIGKVDIIFHFAGVVNEHGICTLESSFEEMRPVLAPKVAGTLNIDSVWKDDELELLVLLSSISATDTKWAKGLADYAAANGFLNGFAECSHKKALALNYALMDAGQGIDKNFDKDVREHILHNNQLAPLDMEQVIHTFFSCLSHYTVNKSIHIYEGINNPTDTLAETAEPHVIQEQIPEHTAAEATRMEKGKLKEIFYGIVENFVDEKIDSHSEQTNFMELGVDSLTGIKMVGRLKEELNVNLYPTVIFEYQTPEQLYQYVAKLLTMEGLEPREQNHRGTEKREASAKKEDKVAVVGVALRAPEVKNLEDLWDVVINRRVVLSEITPGHFVSSSTDKRYVGGEIKEAYEFDPMFFGISPTEANCMDPQQRMFLKVAYEAMQDASLIADDNKKVGVYVGSEQNTYFEQFNNGRYVSLLEEQLEQPDVIAKMKDILAAVKMKPDAVAGNSMNELAARVSYSFGLRGPSMVVNTACSSSLVALSIAYADIKNRNVHAAVVGGVNLNLSDAPYVSMDALGALSPKQACRPFDEAADGMMLGEAVVCIVLKSYEDAKADGDYIYGIIGDVTTNNNGFTQGITVPTVAGEKEVMDELIARNQELASNVRYIEAHGTATPLGDPIEISSIQKAYEDYVSGTVYIGSSKGNFGHPLAASGMFSLVKGLAIFAHDEIPPVAGLENPSSYVALTDKFKLARERVKITDDTYCIGINAFGFGGTNAHVALEKYKNSEMPPLAFPQLVCFSAYSESMLQDFAEYIKKQIIEDGENAGGILRKLNQNTKQFAHKVSFIAESAADLCGKLDGIAAGKRESGIYRGYIQKTGASIAVDGSKRDSAYLNDLADLYVKGNKLDFRNLYEGFHSSKSLVFCSEQEYKINQENFYEKAKARRYGVKDLIAEITGFRKEDIQDDMDIEMLGVDSIKRMQLLNKILESVKLEELNTLNYDIEKIMGMNTVEEFETLFYAVTCKEAGFKKPGLM
ncbi:MAG: SDR family NAD(P)-dependent oxidoreductase [Clostridium sp.]|nr:SDR family NAD(P)-dependent oxidoreductase [Clostridium sp.]